MFFGEYLVVKNVINEDQLLDALTYQIEHLPSFLRVLREEKTFSSEELFNMMKVQMETNSDLITVIRDENKVDEKQLHQLLLRQASHRKMLGEVLVELKITDQATVENMLYDFLRDKENIQSISNAKQIAAVENMPAEVEISEAALESMRELGLVFEGSPAKDTVPAEPVEANIFVDEYLGTFSGKMKNKLQKLIEILNKSMSDDSDISNYFNSLYRDLHILRGAAQVAELSLTENFLGEWETVIAKNLTLKNDAIRKWCVVGLPALEKGIDHLWKMREVVDKHKSEAKISSMTEIMKNQSQIIESIKTL